MAHLPYQNNPEGNLGWSLPSPSDNANSSGYYSHPPGLHAQPPPYSGHAPSLASFQKPPALSYQNLWQPTQHAQPFPIPIQPPTESHLIAQNPQMPSANPPARFSPATAGAQASSSWIGAQQQQVEIAQSAIVQSINSAPSHTEPHVPFPISDHNNSSTIENDHNKVSSGTFNSFVPAKQAMTQMNDLNISTEDLRGDAIVALKQLFGRGVDFNALLKEQMLGSGMDDVLRELFNLAGLPTHHPVSSSPQPMIADEPAVPMILSPSATEEKSQTLPVKKQHTPPITRPRQSREEYLAALAKARAQSKLNEASPKAIPTSPRQISDPPKSERSMSKTVESPPSTSTPKSKLTTKQNDEIRRRLEALKRMQHLSSKTQATNLSVGDSTPSTIEYISRRASRTPEPTTERETVPSTPQQIVEQTSPQANIQLQNSMTEAISTPSSFTRAETAPEPKNIPGLFMGPTYTNTFGYSVPTGLHSSPRTISNPIRPIPRLIPDESVVIELSSDEDDDETDSEFGEAHTPLPSPPKGQQRANILNRVHSMNSSGTQTPDQAALRLLEIEQQKARMLEMIAKREQMSKAKAVKTIPPVPYPTPVSGAISTATPSTQHATLSNQPVIQASRASSLSIEAQKRDAARQARIDELKRELERLQNEDRMELDDVNVTAIEQDGLLEGEETSDIEGAQAAEQWLQQNIKSPSNGAAVHESNPPNTAINLDNTVKSPAQSGMDSKGEEDGELSESDMELSSPVEVMREFEPIPPVFQNPANNQTNHPEGSISDDSDDLYGYNDVPDVPHANVADTSISDHAPPFAAEALTPESTPHEQPTEDKILLDSAEVDDPVDNDTKTGVSLLVFNQQDHMLTTDDESDTDDYEPEVHMPSTSRSPSDTPQITVVDDLAPELQPVQSPHPLSLPVKRNAFTAYESPLKMFKAYRYHPEYGSTVTTGFGSMTYCNNINPEISICQWEADGGVCNDPQCSGQHFKDMRLADSKILLDLGLECPSTNEEVKFAWHEGLKVFSEQLRAEKVRDPEVIARKLVEFRRTFIGDPSRVLNLGDVQI